MRILVTLIVAVLVLSCNENKDSFPKNGSKFRIRVIDRVLGVQRSDSLREYYFENIYEHEVVNMQESIEYDSLAFILDSLASQASSLFIKNNNRIKLFSSLEEYKKYEDYVSYEINLNSLRKLTHFSR